MSFDETQENMTISSDFDVSDFLEERRKRKASSPGRLIPALEDYVRRHFLPERNGGQPMAAQMMGAAKPNAMKASVGMALNALRDAAAEDEVKTSPKKKSFGLFRKSAEKPTLLPTAKSAEKPARTSVALDSAAREEMHEFGKKAEEADYHLCEAEAEWDIEAHESAINERMTHLSDTYQQYLFYLIESKGMSNAEVYKRAIVDKKVFAKIKANPDYHPKKMTALCLCVGAKLNLDETRDLLARAGYALSPCDKTDVIFSYFIENEIYDMIEIDIQLEEHGLPCIIA